MFSPKPETGKNPKPRDGKKGSGPVGLDTSCCRLLGFLGVWGCLNPRIAYVISGLGRVCVHVSDVSGCRLFGGCCGFEGFRKTQGLWVFRA